MSSFSKSLRSWSAPQNGYFCINYGYQAYDPSQLQNGYWGAFVPDTAYPCGKLGNIDDDGFPTNLQMLDFKLPLVAENKINGIYSGPDEYFQTHFGLMEEDFMFQVRKALEEFVYKPVGDGSLKESKVYENVMLKNLKSCTMGGGSYKTCVMDFEDENTRYAQPSFGNFLVFFKSEGEKYPICVGMVVRDASQTDEEYSEIQLHFDDEDHDIEDLAKLTFYVLEPNNSFFLCYLYIYKTLNSLYSSNKFSKFRMAPYIMYGKGNATEKVGPPEYLHEGTRYRIYDKDFRVLQEREWPHKPDHLNLSQYTALRRALTEELAIVQGPPGTGKTYFGIELVRVLLEDVNISNWNPRSQTPLLVICHSNHALDHFLEGIHKFTDKYVRVGLRCESEIIKPKCLVELVCRDIAPKDVEDDCTCEVVVKKFRQKDFEYDDEESDEDSGHGRDDESEEGEMAICESKYCKSDSEIPGSKCYCMSSLRRCLDLIDETRGQMRDVKQGIVNFKILQYWGVIDEETAQWFEMRRHQNGYLKWLGLDNIKVDNKTVEWQDNTYLLVSLDELKKRLEKLNRKDKTAKILNDSKNTVISIVQKFEQSSREDFFGDASDIFTLTPTDTRKVYVKWLDSLSYRLRRTVSELEKKLYYNFWVELSKRDRYECMLKHLKSAHVVGLTSTGAAARRTSKCVDKKSGEVKPREGILEKLESPIVILEEAAQILESHVIASMTVHCKHLIMLGDHQQLKPCINAQYLASKYLNVSLFERLLRNEVIRQECLTFQNRMRPEIADLLRPHYYANLRDAPPTKKRPAIRGLRHNLFFLDHRVPEKKADKIGNKGFWNPHELDLLLKLSQFLVTKGYLPSQITIISMYNEQRRRLIEERENIPSLANLEITSVDGFQGKENEIILLSLVRSNDRGNIGFLDEESRICVALSRARSGLYIMGNMRCLTKYSKMWRKVSERLEEKGAIGPVLNLACDKHKIVRPLSAKGDWECSSCTEGRKKRQEKRVKRSNRKRIV